MLTTPVERRFSRSFLFSICPLPFLALGPELRPFSGAPSGSSSSPRDAGAPAAAAEVEHSSSGRREPGAARGSAEGPRAQLRAVGPGAAGAAAPAGPWLSSAVPAAAAADGDSCPAGDFAAGSPPPPPPEPGTAGFCLARIFSRFAFHSSRKSVVVVLLLLPPLR